MTRYVKVCVCMQQQHNFTVGFGELAVQGGISFITVKFFFNAKVIP